MRRIMLLLAAALVALVGAGASSAQRAVHLSNAIDLNESFEAEDLSEQCGFPVTITFSGELDVTLIYNEEGLVVREIDTAPAARTTFSSPYGSFSFPSALTLIFTYPGGATLGGTANVTFSGLFSHVTGLPSDAGIDIVGDAVVIGFTPEGIPDVAFAEETTFISHGNRESEENVVSAICSALSPA
jgi:hypothetical protein